MFHGLVVLFLCSAQLYAPFLGYAVYVVNGHAQNLGGATRAYPALLYQIDGVRLCSCVKPLAECQGFVASVSGKEWYGGAMLRTRAAAVDWPFRYGWLGARRSFTAGLAHLLLLR